MRFLFAGLQAVRPGPGEARPRGEPTECRQAHGLHQEGAEALQHVRRGAREEAGQAARDHPEAAAAIAAAIPDDNGIGRNESINSPPHSKYIYPLFLLIQ